MNINIAGIQKLTLLDYPEKVACTIFLEGCNLRCPFCHNSEIIHKANESKINYNELMSFLKDRKNILDGVCVSGGEPTIYKELPLFLRKIKDMGFMVKLDTNGCNPDMLRELLDKNIVDYVAMDIKNSPTQYGTTVGIEKIDLSKIEESILCILEKNIQYEFRTTVVDELHNKESIEEMGRWLSQLGGKKEIDKLFLQPFIDRESVLKPGLHTPLDKEIQEYKKILKKYISQVKIRTEE